MRILAAAALLAASLFATGCGESAPDASDAADLLSGAPTSFPATIEGPVFFDLAEAELEMSDLDAGTDVIAIVDLGEPGGVPIYVNIPGNLVKDAGIQGDGEQMRITISGKSSETGMELLNVTALQKL